MKKALISIMTATLLLCLAACMAVPEEESLPPSTEKMMRPPHTPKVFPRAAEEALPPTEKNIFPVGREGIYMSSVSAGPDGMMAILADGSMVSLGMIPGVRTEDPEVHGFSKVLNNEDNFDYVSCSQFGCFAIDEEGTLWGWGTIASWGNITGVAHDAIPPYRLLTDVQMASIRGGTYLALRKDGTVWMWGEGSHGEFGKGSEFEVYSMAHPLTEPVKALENVIYANFSGGNIYAIKEDNSLWIWGNLGVDPETEKMLYFDNPVCVMEDVKYAYGSLVLKTDGTLWEIDTDWLNMFDKPGRALYSDVKAVQIMEDVKLAKSEDYYSSDEMRFFAIKNDGSLWVWGCNLAAETEEYVDEPVKIMDGVVYADSSEGNFAALKSNGELWAIGMPYKAISYPPDPENASAEEELLYSRLPHKILDGVLVSGAF
ncbi:MAG: hypothetical protein GXY01_00315 [Clostridiales bacterium]|jgi:hypothetical protein|nr:hypothetical protein [Clostridiales bacterium]